MTDVVKLPTLELNQITLTLFWELLPKLEEIFGKFKKAIETELSNLGLRLKYEKEIYPIVQRHRSGSFTKTAVNAVSVYGLDKIDIIKW